MEKIKTQKVNGLARKIVIIESPLNADDIEGFERNMDYAKACLMDSLLRGESPYASHILYTHVLRDSNEHERAMGMIAGIEFTRVADLVAVYGDKGVSKGMESGIQEAIKYGVPYEFRSLDGDIDDDSVS